MKLSVDSTPIGSVGISALPVSETTRFTSGNDFSTRSMRVTVASEAERSMPGNFSEVTTIEPSESFGRNSPPSRVASTQEPAKRASVASTVTEACRSAAFSIGV
ncbi:hypothetical protein ABIC24_002731 [Methylobacterium radiotolerans]